MSSPRRPEKPSPKDLPPGADRFWGQFSEARGGRSANEEPEAEAPGRDAPAGEHECLEWCPICRSAELLRATASPEIRQQLQTLQNEAFQIFRAFAAAYAERGSTDPDPGPAGSAGAPRNGQRGGAAQRGGGPDEPRVTDITIE
ncbi:MAG: hypothetical protein KDB62_08600 [Solirubrobacterales bacterium]|nr:hypothetical protein [Solirubrobacterales bacterium]